MKWSNLIDKLNSKLQYNKPSSTESEMKMVTSSYDTLIVADPTTAWQDSFYESRRANMTKPELAAIDAVEAYAIRHGKANTNLNDLHNSLWMHWKSTTGTVKANRHELDLLSEFVNWLNLEP